MKLSTSKGIILVLAILLMLLFAPAFWINNGTKTLPLEQRLIAETALQQAEIGCLDHPFSRVFVIKKRIAELEIKNDNPLEFSARVNTDTVFGIPTGSILVTGKETICE